jgi:hypothetical protein
MEEGKNMNKGHKPGKASTLIETDSNDFDFRHHLHDTIILLGGKREIADLVERSQDYQLQVSDVDELRKYNGALIDQTKDRLAKIHKTKLRPKSK